MGFYSETISYSLISTVGRLTFYYVVSLTCYQRSQKSSASSTIFIFSVSVYFLFGDEFPNTSSNYSKVSSTGSLEMLIISTLTLFCSVYFSSMAFHTSSRFIISSVSLTLFTSDSCF